jgi:hypothetical protein
MSGDAAFDNHDMANEAVASLALIAKLPNGGVALGLAAWAMQLTGPEIAWVWPFSVSSACEVSFARSTSSTPNSGWAERSARHSYWSMRSALLPKRSLRPGERPASSSRFVSRQTANKGTGLVPTRQQTGGAEFF